MESRMKVYVAKCVLGILALDEKGEIVDSEMFTGNLSTARIAESEKRLLERFRGHEILPGDEILRLKLDDIIRGLGRTREEYNSILHKSAVEFARKSVKKALLERDLTIIQAINTLDDVEELLNVLTERLASWYSLYFPEGDIEEHAKFVEEVSGKKELIERLNAADAEVVLDFADAIKRIHKFRTNLESYINSATAEIAPNTSQLAGSLLTARLISLANGLLKLARMPAGRIQLLGAEKSLFGRKTKPPKHGIIFQYPLIKRAPWWQRGKIARNFAGKIAIAARTDAFSDNYLAEKLKEDFLERVEEIRKKYPKEPAKKERQKR